MAPVRNEDEEKNENVPKILCEMDNHLGKFGKSIFERARAFFNFQRGTSIRNLNIYGKPLKVHKQQNRHKKLTFYIYQGNSLCF